jgi:hypothetical protein
MTSQKEFDAIFSAWSDDIGHMDIFHMIVEWVAKHKSTIKSVPEIEDIEHRIVWSEAKELVEDFIYGVCYERLRAEFGKIV